LGPACIHRFNRKSL